MARLYEHQGKEILRRYKINVPAGKVARSAEEAEAIARELGGEVVLKAQIFTTKRAEMGGIRFAISPEEAKELAAKMLGVQVGNFTIEAVLVEQKLKIAQEFYAGIILDENVRGPALIFSSKGGTGIEEIAKEHPDKVSRVNIDIMEGLHGYQARNLVRRCGISGKLQQELGEVLVRLYQVAREVEARACEINPLVLTDKGELFAADCRITVDDYAVYRHKELGIDYARELDHPPTKLERIAYKVEEGDYRGTFFFIQLAKGYKRGDGYIGFHGAGGGGSMMSMDAITARGFKLANYTDTSGNPPASKVYRAARIILAQGPIDGYFGSGSGVASQEQVHSARGLVKAFKEMNLSIPAVIRLGGNMEDQAVYILTQYTKDLPAPVEGYKKDDTPDFCARRLEELIKKQKERSSPLPHTKRIYKKPQGDYYSFETLTGRVIFDYQKCSRCANKVCVERCVPKILKLENGLPVLGISYEEAKRGRCIECLVCEVECEAEGAGGGYVELPIEGLEEIEQERAKEEG